MSLKLLQGNEAAALAAIKAGVRFYAGYPITPSSEVAEIMSRELPKVNGIFIQMEDEIGSLAACIGARLGGMKAMTATSGPGFSLMQEHLGYAAMTEVPVVILNAMRGGPSTGAPTRPSQGDVMQARWGTHGDHPIVVFAPQSVSEVFQFVIDAVNISEILRIPVVVLTDEITSHMREKVNIPETIEIFTPPPIVKENYLPYSDDNNVGGYLLPFGEGVRYHITGLIHREDGFPSNNPEIARKNLDRFKKKMEKALKYAEDVEEYLIEDAEIIFFPYGIVARAVKEVVEILRKKGVKAGYIRPKIIWPFPHTSLEKIDGKVEYIIVPEMNQGQLVYEIMAHVKNSKVIPVNRYDGELFDPDELVKSAEELIK